jgi:serine/threonine protein kinase
MPSVTIGTTLAGPNEELFNITDFLGNGAFGEVYRAAGEQSGAVVAVKLLPLSFLVSERSKLALLNEIRIAQQVQHPNVVQVLYVNDGESSAIGPYVIMEYVSGGTLARLLQTQRQSRTDIPFSRAVEIMIDIAQGARAINRSVIHRDIKPDNILIEGNKLKIGDFGISKFVDESTRLHTFKGGQHVAYMAPEGWQNEANTFKLDVYSVGLLFYEVLTLQHPLLPKVRDPNNFLDWEKAHLYEPCPDVRSLRNDVPVSIAQLLTRMANKRPVERPDWDEILRVLTQPQAVAQAVEQHPAIKAAVDTAIQRKNERDKARLQAEKVEHDRERQVGLYRYSCDALLQELTPVVNQFNEQFQHGQIEVREELGFTIFVVPMGSRIHVHFFEPKKSGIQIRSGEVIGGGWIGLSRGRSANLVLLKHGADDLYGRWAICEVKIMALANPQALIGKFGLTKDTVIPFGFSDAYFYDQIQYATGTLHVFTYNFIDDVPGFFAGLLNDALQMTD